MGRICAPFGVAGKTLSCCLPCPVTDWIYSSDFPNNVRAANRLAIVAIVLEVFVLVTYASLPIEESRRDYLNVGLMVSLMCVAGAFIIPLGSDPSPCKDAITPNDLHTDTSCASTGLLVEAGAMGSVCWCRGTSMPRHACGRC